MQHVDEPHALKNERWELLSHLNQLFDKPITALAFVWVGLLILDFVQGLGPLLQTLNYLIWAIFILDFVIEFVIAPEKITYLKRNWLSAVSLVLPALRVFRALRILRAVRTIRTVGLLRLITSVNRSMRATATTLGRHSVGYVFAITILVIFIGAAGIAYFENPTSLREAGYSAEEGSINSYGEAVWWTSMVMTTLGSDYWPQTVEGRILCWLISVYALAILGYITATLATLFLGTRTQESETSLSEEVAALKVQIAHLTALLEKQ